MNYTTNLLTIALICNSVSDIFHMSKTHKLFDEQQQAIEQLKQDITVLQDQNAALKDDIKCLRHNAHDKVFPCVSTVGVSL